MSTSEEDVLIEDDDILVVSDGKKICRVHCESLEMKKERESKSFMANEFFCLF